MRTVRLLLGFALIPLMNAVVPLLALPAVTSSYGKPAWEAIAVGQSIGAGVASVAELGWGLIGPQRVARQSARVVAGFASLSLSSRVLVLSPLSLIGALVSALVVDQDRLLGALTALGASTLALSLAWVFVGLGQPWQVLSTETGVRLAAALLTVTLLETGASPLVYPAVGLVLPGLVAPALGLLVLRRRSLGRIPRFTASQAVRALLLQRAATGTRAASAVYIALPVAIVGVVSPSSAAVFGAGERLLRFALSGLAAVPAIFQKWIGSPKTFIQRRSRAVTAIGVNALIGLVSGLAFFALAPLFSEFLLSGVATITTGQAALLGCLVAIVVTSRATGGLALVAVGDVKALARSAVIGACAGLPAIALLAYFFGVKGAILGELFAESMVLGYQAFVLGNHLRRR